MIPSVILNIGFLLSGLNNQLTLISKINFKHLKYAAIFITSLYAILFVLIMAKGLTYKDTHGDFLMTSMDYGAAVISQLVF